MRSLLRLVVALVLGLSALGALSPGLVLAQSDDPLISAPRERRMEALGPLLKAIKAKIQEARALRQRLSAAQDEVTKKRISDQLHRRLEEQHLIESKFEETAAGVDATLFSEREKAPFSWEQTLGRIIEPILAEIEDATASSRKRASLKEEQASFTERQHVSEEALLNLTRLREATDDPEVSAALEEVVRTWEQRRLLATNQANAARLRLEELEAKQQGIADYGRKFLSTRGLHLLWGVGAAAFVFFLVRISFGLLRERKKEVPGLRTRLVTVLASILSVAGALAALLIVFSAAGDLFLVGIVLVFLLGAGWAGIRVLPEFVESLRLILNIGMVREGERIMFDDVPWRVDTLGFTCYLLNPRLDNAVVRLPVRRLVGLHSRPFCEDEEVFPTLRGDWVALNDGAIGRIVAQSPSNLVLEEEGGARRIYATPSFLELGPRRLSTETFRIETRFGIAYKHQAVATEQVPKWFEEALKRGLPRVLETHELVGVHVEFAEAGSSSLDYEVEVDVVGTTAERHEKIQFSLQRILVEACNEHGLEIPFPQLTVHQG